MASTIHRSPDIIVLTETWLSDESAEMCSIQSYHGYHIIRAGRRSGGYLLVFCSRQCYPLESCFPVRFADATIESCVVEMRSGDKSIIVIAIYRPHSDSIRNIDARLVDMLHHQALHDRKVIITGNFNTNLLADNCLQTESFVLNL